jgi:hypothetical protein
MSTDISPKIFYIVFIGTRFDAPPSQRNPEKIYVFTTSRKLTVGYIHPKNFDNFGIKNFFVRSAFVFSNRPKNIGEILFFEDDMNSIYPYVKVYDKIVVGKYHGYASWWIEKIEKGEDLSEDDESCKKS